MSDIIFYFGSIVIIFAFIGLVAKKWIILLYIVLLVFAIITWRVIYLFLISSTQEMINYNQNIQRVING